MFSWKECLNSVEDALVQRRPGKQWAEVGLPFLAGGEGRKGS